MWCNWRIRLTATTDAGSGSSRRCQVTSGSSTTLMIPTMTNDDIYELREWWSLEHALESWNKGARDQFGMFYWFFLLISSSLRWISAQYKWRRHGLLPPPDHSQVEVEFPCAQDSPKGRHWAVPIGTGTYDFVQFRTQHECIILCSLSFPFLLYGLCSPGDLRLRRGIM